MTPAQARTCNSLRREHEIHVCYFSTYGGGPCRWKFYVMHRDQVAWNPVNRNAEGKVTGYTLFDTYEAGLKEALAQASAYAKKLPTPAPPVTL